jgi:putative ABC transport system permease protein
MKLTNLLKIAYRSLSRNKLRSFLTMLGIIIGVASVIAMLAIGQGSKQNIQASVESLGSNTIMLIPGAFTQGGVRLEAGSSNSLRREDAEAISTRCDLVEYVSPIVNKGVQVISGSQNWRTMIFGVLNDYFAIRTFSVISGSNFTPSDDRAAAKVW